MAEGVRNQLARRQPESRGGYRLVRPPKGSGTALAEDCNPVALFRFKSMHDDYIVGRFWDGVAEGTEDIKVQKQWAVRQSPFDGDEPYLAGQHAGVSYIHKFNTGAAAVPNKREASGGLGSKEIQQVTPGYVLNDLFFAVQLTDGLSGLKEVEVVNDVDTIRVLCTSWMEIEVDKRSFARQF